MSAIYDIHNPWRDILLSMPASFNGIIFNVETGSRASGRRTVTHEYPKRNVPYAEDMGKHARRFSFSGYLIYRPRPVLYEYTSQRVRLIAALEADDAHMLVHPVFCQGGMMAMCERYSMIESREKGGYTQFEMQFVEAGTPGNTMTIINTVANVAAMAQNLATAAAGLINNTLGP